MIVIMKRSPSYVRSIGYTTVDKPPKKPSAPRLIQFRSGFDLLPIHVQSYTCAQLETSRDDGLGYGQRVVDRVVGQFGADDRLGFGLPIPLDRIQRSRVSSLVRHTRWNTVGEKREKKSQNQRLVRGSTLQYTRTHYRSMGVFLARSSFSYSSSVFL